MCACAISGCSSNEEENSENSQVAIAYENLYQGDSIDEALLFMKVPDDRREITRPIVERYGSLAIHDELEFAKQLFVASRTREFSRYKDLLSHKMLELLKNVGLILKFPNN